MKYRIEKDTMGAVEVPVNRLWGAQTQRSKQNFLIGTEKMPMPVIYALARLKKCCAMVNGELGRLDAQKREAIAAACDEITAGQHDKEFPLVVWQTGSGTQSNMNVNEVIANLATISLGGDIAGEKLVHPNDDVNMSQSSNDIFPTAMHVSAVIALEDQLLPALSSLENTFLQKAEQFQKIVKIGRTHLMDATPLTLGQETSGWQAMLAVNGRQLRESLEHMRALAVGGTAVGTGINSPPQFGERVAEIVSRETGTHFYAATNKFQALTSHDALVAVSGSLKALAANLMKIANDIRWLASGPRCGISEITIPANEPGSSIMPGKVNPTQAEALTMVACQVFGNDATIGFAASQGNFQLNVFKPVIIYNFLQSVQLLADSMRSFNDHCASGIEPNLAAIDHNLHNSLMLVTALNSHIGYEKSAQIAQKAHAENTTLREAAMSLGFLSGEEFDKLIKPGEMTHPAK
jgi:fumarate hydratase class II